MTKAELLNTIRAKIERLKDKGKYHEEYDCAWRDGNNNACNALLSFLDTLKKEQENDTDREEQIEEIRAEIVAHIEQLRKIFDTLEVPKKQIILVLKQDMWEAQERFRKGERLQEPEVDLEEEADRMFFSLGWYEGDHHQPMLDCVSLEQFRGIARHFAEWGATHLKR